MNMKLLLFILGLTLCASWPTFSRNLAGSSEENNEEHSFLDFLDGELGEYDNFADGDNDNSFDLFDLNFHLNEEGEVNTSLGEENNEESLPEEPSDEPTEETPEEPTEETPEQPTEETPAQPTEETPEEPTEATPEENTEAVVETPEENTEDTTQEENPVPEDLLTQVRGDAEANDVLNFGVSTIIAQGIKNNKIPNDNFTVTSISTYNKTANAKRNVYQISCVATNANGSSVLNINFTVSYQLSNQRKTLSSWSYNIKTSNPVTPITEYVQLGEDEISTETVQKVLNYGAAQIYAKGTQAGKIPVSDFTISDVVSVWKQATTNGFNYRCQVVLENNNKVTVNANFTVALKSSNQQTSFIQWSYNVKNVSSNTNNNTTTPTNNTTPSNNTTNTNTTNSTNPTNNNTTQPTTNNTTPANNTNTNNDGFVELETAEIETSGEVQGALEYGTNQIIQSGNAKGKIPVSNYTITKVNSVERKTQSNGRNTYRCDVELQDAKKVITAQFTVYVKVATQEFSIGSWTYNISNIKSSNSNGSTNTTPNNNTNTSNNTNTNNNNTNNNNNTTQPTNNTTNNNNNNNATQPTTNTTTPANTTNTTATNFTALTQDEINSAEVQGALNFGANRVIQIGEEKGQIPVSNYTITKVNSVGKQVASNGRNLYKCDVELQDVNKVLVKAQFNVYVKVATQERSVGAWSYQVSNKGNATKPSTNTTNSATTKTL